ncbi:hypothetical protein KP509_32G014800 [Ceratopteris richardii]|uniref:ATP-dependent Zn protease n=1 Tax=Ceratopteris richardii TaxID=49495 RepID=A0A8T2QSN1_CERRI|nr:hypothetical protein KP509_32G014800 [Ceratopteris richardii]
MDVASRGCLILHSYIVVPKPWKGNLIAARPYCSSIFITSLSTVLVRCDAGNATQQESWTSILQRVDLELAAGNETQALSLLETANLKGFGQAAQVPQRLYSLADLRLNDIDTSRFLSPVDTTLGNVQRNLQIAAALGGIVIWQALQPSQIQVLSALVALLLVSGIDLVVYNGGVQALLLDTIGRITSEKYKNRVAQHEAGHFLVAYLLGILPKDYTLSSLDAYLKEGSLSVQAGTRFVDTKFQEEVNSGKLSAGSLNKYSCIALAGVSTEYLLYGLAEGGLADIQQYPFPECALNIFNKEEMGDTLEQRVLDN